MSIDKFLFFFLSIFSIFEMKTNRYLTIFQDGEVYLDISPFNIKNEYIILNCKEKMILKSQNHAIKVRNTFYFRAFLGVFRNDFVNMTCTIFFPSEKITKILKVYFLNRIFDKLKLPNTLSFPKVNELDFIDNSGRHHITKSQEFCPSKRRKIYLTLTTSPSRLLTLHMVLNRLNLSLIDNIFVTIPKLFRQKIVYKIPVFLKNKYQKIIFLSEKQDFGPIMKIVSPVQFLYESCPDVNVDNSIFISIDDDQQYKNELVNYLVNLAVTHRHSIITLNYFEHLHISLGSQPPVNMDEKSDEFFRPNGLMGYSGVAYKGWHIKKNINLIKFFTDSKSNSNFINCFKSDDLILSTVLKLNGIEIIQPFNHNMIRVDFNWSKDSFSLHKTDIKGHYIKSNRQNHEEKYQHCHSYIISYLLDKKKANIDYIDKIRHKYFP